MRTSTVHLILLDLITIRRFCEEYKFWSSSSCTLSYVPVTYS